MNKTFAVILLTISIGATLTPDLQAQAQPPTAEELITQLGSNQFSQRERAFQELEARGLSVLPQLRQGRQPSRCRGPSPGA